jgi:hypothetical protein
MQIMRLTLLGAASKASYELNASNYLLDLNGTLGGNVVLRGVPMERSKERLDPNFVVLA